ncbi:alkaline phosphatase family protein [Niabella sp. CC-SYL272]|uniref:alkaline phosphatase family protein n=1 Tax=Niabella agricola TaxID=2891571 RepID=UPI001F48D8FD|nr:alkaline phosphatase family protein [Niabella agricola]MCF3111796.1 alkaline phosphatase family protein [Niabella agricola]
MKRQLIIGNYCLAMGIAVALAAGCKKYPNVAPVFEKQELNADSVKRKVLVISIDGLPGSELKAATGLTNIAALLKTAKFSYAEARLPRPATDGSSWASLLTGVTPVTHGITDSSFEYKNTDPASSGGRVPYAMDIFRILNINKPSYTSALVTPWANLARYAERTATYSYGVLNDAVVKDSAVRLLNRDTSLSLMVVNFNEVALAGKAAGNYSLTNPAYKTALEKADGYIGNILQAMNARPGKSKEQWLVIVTSNPGAVANPLPGFLICAYPSFSGQEVKKVGYSTVLFNDDTSTYAYVPNPELYDPKLPDEFTVQVRTYNLDGRTYPGIISKSSPKIGNIQNSIKGWMWLNVSNGAVQYEANFGSGSQKAPQTAVSGSESVNQWHTYTMQVRYTSSTNRRVTMFVDGNNRGGAFDLSLIDFSNPAEPFKLGFRKVDASIPMQFYAADLVYFNTALPDSIIKNYVNLVDYSRHPYYKNLTGWWPLDEASGNVAYNYAPTGSDMVLNGSFRWVKLDPNVPPGRTPAPPDATVSINAAVTDIAAHLKYWMNLKTMTVGISNSWLSNFSAEIK